MKIRHPEKIKNPINPIKRKPDWIKSKLVNSKGKKITGLLTVVELINLNGRSKFNFPVESIVSI